MVVIMYINSVRSESFCELQGTFKALKDNENREVRETRRKFQNELQQETQLCDYLQRI